MTPLQAVCITFLFMSNLYWIEKWRESEEQKAELESICDDLFEELRNVLCREND